MFKWHGYNFVIVRSLQIGFDDLPQDFVVDEYFICESWAEGAFVQIQ